jgi:hypothetical protein
MSAPIHGRFFLVGCPRSGTTLLQSMIAAHRDVISFPESHFFKRLQPQTRWLRPLGVASTVARPVLQEYVQSLDEDLARAHVPPGYTIRIQSVVDAFVDVLDELTARNDRQYWLEKTPGHVQYVDLIEQYVPDTQFIHLFRNGTDVVASLYDVTRKYPEEWDGPWSLDRCINQWVDDLKASLDVCDRDHHHVVRYEALIASPQTEIHTLIDCLGLPSDPDVLERRRDTVEDIRTSSEEWKGDVDGQIYNANASKFRTLLSDDQQQTVRRRIEHAGLAEYA